MTCNLKNDCEGEKVSNFSITGALQGIKASSNKFVSIVEAITNSLEADAENIKIIVNNDNFLKDEFDISCVEILDDGRGIDNVSEENKYGNFAVLFTNRKNKNNKGCGRIQYLHYFKEVEITDKKNNLHFSFSQNNVKVNENGIKDLYEKISIEDGFNTKIKLNTLKDKYKDELFKILKSKHTIKQEILLHCLKIMLINKKFEKLTIKLNWEDNEETITRDEINNYRKTAENEKDNKISIPKVKKQYNKEEKKFELVETENKEEFDLEQFEIPSDLLSKNSICLCAKNVIVQDIKSKIGINQNVCFDNKRFLCFISGEKLDENVNTARDGFTDLPNRKDLLGGDLYSEQQEYLCFDDIIKGVRMKVIDKVDAIKKMNKDKDERIDKVGKEVLASEDEIKAMKSRTDIKLDTTDEEIREKYVEYRATQNDKQNQKIQSDFKNIIKKILTNNLNEEDGELLTLHSEIEEANKDTLMNYVLYRAYQVELFKQIINCKFEDKNGKEKTLKEKIIHDLIFKQNTDSNNNKNHGLWMLNEDFANYEYITSNIALKDVKYNNKNIFDEDIENQDVLTRCNISQDFCKDKKPDLLLFHKLGSIVIVDFKSITANAFDFVQQVRNYAKLIYSKTKPEFHYFEHFYCYIVGENPSLENDDFTLTPDKQGWYAYLKVKDMNEKRKDIIIYEEVNKYSNLQFLAELRNKNFSDRAKVDYKKIKEHCEQVIKDVIEEEKIKTNKIS